MSSPLRLAVVGTPRCGNTWFRKLLSGLYQIPDSASHETEAIDREDLPLEVVHQIHWYPTNEFVAKLHERGFQVVTLTRHPLDVLISILHFAWYNPEVERWLLGQEGNERSLRGVMPRSRSFLDYAKGARAKALLGVSEAWWQYPGVFTLRYEDLFRDPRAALAAVEERFGPGRTSDLEEVIARNSMKELRKESFHNHFWMGRPGMARKLLTGTEYEELSPVLEPHLKLFGYEATPDPELDAATADRNWSETVGQELIATVEKNMSAFHEHHAKVDQFQREILSRADRAEQERDQLALQLAASQVAVQEQRRETESLAHKLQEMVVHMKNLEERFQNTTESLVATLSESRSRLERAENAEATCQQLSRQLEIARTLAAQWDGFPAKVAARLHQFRCESPKTWNLCAGFFDRKTGSRKS